MPIQTSSKMEQGKKSKKKSNVPVQKSRVMKPGKIIKKRSNVPNQKSRVMKQGKVIKKKSNMPIQKSRIVVQNDKNKGNKKSRAIFIDSLKDIGEPTFSKEEGHEEIVSVAANWGPIVNVKPMFSIDSKFLLVVSGNTVRVLSTETGKLLQKRTYHEHKVVGIRRSFEDKDHYVTVDESGVACFWRLYTEQVKKFALRIQSKGKVVAFEFYPGTRQLFVAVDWNWETGSLYLFEQPYVEKNSRYKLMEVKVQLGQNKFALSPNGRNIAVCTDTGLVILNNRKANKNMGQRPWMIHTAKDRFLPTCVAYHPSKDILAVGDKLGRVVLWYEFDDLRPKKQVMHWHELPVGDIAISESGTELYSGGGECVLVKWQLSSENRSFLPRMGMPIKYVVTDKTNEMIAVCHADNGISLITAKSCNVAGVIQGFSMNIDNEVPFPVGLVYDPRTRAVVTNSKTGYVQFYDIMQHRLLYHVNITLSNYYTQEQHQKISNTEVQRVALSPDGYCMASVEYRPDDLFTPEIRLKFWKFEKTKQEWYLNTSIDLPHRKPVNDIAFQCLPDNSLFCVTCSDDGKFKIWEEIDSSDIYGTKTSWTCVNESCYHDLLPTSLCISPDASLLAVGFSSILTLWEPSPCQFKGSLSQPYLTEKILQIEFGRGEGCQSLIVTRSSEWLCVWNLLMCSLLWRVSVRSTCLAADPLSQYMALFSENGDLYIFNPQRSKAVSVQEKVTGSGKPLAVTFIPRTKKVDETTFWNYNSSLHYLSSEQSLHTLEVARDINYINEKIGEEVRQLVPDTADSPAALTPFASLMAPVRTTHAAEERENEAASADFGVKLEKSTLFIQKVLDEARICKLDTFAQLVSEFCKMVLPEVQTSEQKIPQDFHQEVKKRKWEGEMMMMPPSKKINTTELKKVAETDFSDLMEILAF